MFRSTASSLWRRLGAAPLRGFSNLTIPGKSNPKSFPIALMSILFPVGGGRWRYLTSDSGGTAALDRADHVTTQWNSPTVDDIHVTARPPSPPPTTTTGINTGFVVHFRTNDFGR